MPCTCESGPACRCGHEKCKCCPFLCDCEKCFTGRENYGVQCDPCGGEMDSVECSLIHRWRPQLNPNMNFIIRHDHWFGKVFGACICNFACYCCPFLCVNHQLCQELKTLNITYCRPCNGEQQIPTEICWLINQWTSNGLYPSLDFIRAHANDPEFNRYRPVADAENPDPNNSSSDPNTSSSDSGSAPDPSPPQSSSSDEARELRMDRESPHKMSRRTSTGSKLRNVPGSLDLGSDEDISAPGVSGNASCKHNATTSKQKESQITDGASHVATQSEGKYASCSLPSSLPFDSQPSTCLVSEQSPTRLYSTPAPSTYNSPQPICESATLEQDASNSDGTQTSPTSNLSKLQSIKISDFPPKDISTSFETSSIHFLKDETQKAARDAFNGQSVIASNPKASSQLNTLATQAEYTETFQSSQSNLNPENSKSDLSIDNISR